MVERHFIITIIPVKKPHIPVTFNLTNNPVQRQEILGIIEGKLKEDSAMQITILRDCHSDTATQE